MKQLNIQLLLTGNELMSGDIVDTNSVMIAQRLKQLGLAVSRKVTVADDMQLLLSEINSISAQADILIINGGLGPTVDDMTAQALAQAASLPVTEHSEALAHLKLWCQNRDHPLSQPTLKQALLPKGCNIIGNSVGSAVGFHLNHQGCDIYCTPGVPVELQSMLSNEIIPALKQKIPHNCYTHVTRLQVFGMGESSLQKMIDQEISDWPEQIALGFRACKPYVEIKLTSKDRLSLQQKGHCITRLKALLGDHIIGEIDQQELSIAQQVFDLLHSQGLKITTAESCTGGLISSMLTQVPGASMVFEAGYVTYSNQIKSQALGVDQQVITHYGAVSEQTVLAMALGAIAKSNADLAIAVSGIAGPDGGSQDKPVGTVWLAWGSLSQMHSQCLVIPGNRIEFQQYVATLMLDLIRRRLLCSKQIPHYITQGKCAVSTSNH